MVDDDRDIRKSTERLLKSFGYRVQAFSSPGEFLKVKDYEIPSCLLLDVRMPEISGLKIFELIRKKIKTPPVIFISGHSELPTAVKAMKNGAIDFLSKPLREKELIKSVHTAIELSRKEREKEKSCLKLDTLSKREKEILSLMKKGHINKKIGAILSISESTVKKHRRNILKKMNLSSFSELIQTPEK